MRLGIIVLNLQQSKMTQSIFIFLIFDFLMRLNSFKKKSKLKLGKNENKIFLIKLKNNVCPKYKLFDNIF